jgi:dihydroorotase
MVYDTSVGSPPSTLARVRQGRLHEPSEGVESSGQTILKGGTVIDPANDVDGERDLALQGSYVVEVGDNINPERGDRVYDVRGLQVWPGLIDIHLHLGDLFETSSAPIFESVADGVTVALSPGASNTFMAPSLLGAEVDRGVPVNIGVYLGGLNVITSTLR